jgi:hypothetical protein
MSYNLRIIIPQLPAITSNGSHGHWLKTARKQREWRRLVVYNVGFRTPDKPLEKASVTFIRHSSVQPDDDNLRISFKSVRDGLKDAGVIIDDKPANLPNPIYKWERAPKGAGFISIFIQEITTSDLESK